MSTKKVTKLTPARARLAQAAPEHARDVVRIPLERIVEGPNPRTASWGSIEELSLSLLEGQLEPVLVRPLGDGRFELIDGARRRRAAERAELPSLEAIVLDLEGVEVEQARLVKNVQREQLSEVEQAHAFEALRKTGLSLREIGFRVGRTERFVSQAVRLLELEPVWREALEAGRLERGAALYVAQLDAGTRAHLAGELDWDLRQGLGGIDAVSLRDVEERLDADTHDLTKAPFELTTEGPNGPCTTCPHRTGMQGVLFEAIREDRCLSKTCWDAKVSSVWQSRAQEAEKSGVRVVEGVRHAPGLADLDGSVDNALRKAGVWDTEHVPDMTVRELLLDATGEEPRPTAIALERSVVVEGVPIELVRQALQARAPELARQLEEAAAEDAEDSQITGAAAQKKREEDWKRRQAKEDLERKVAGLANESAIVELVARFEAMDCVDRVELAKLFAIEIAELDEARAGDLAKRRGWDLGDGTVRDTLEIELGKLGLAAVEGVLLELVARMGSPGVWGPLTGRSGLERLAAWAGISLADTRKAIAAELAAKAKAKGAKAPKSKGTKKRTRAAEAAE